MKFSKHRVLIVGLATLSLTLLVTLAGIFYQIHTKSRQVAGDFQPAATNFEVLGTETVKKKQGLPVRLMIPSIGVDAAVEYVGLNNSGEMNVPSKTINVGWFYLGPRPGEKGSSVIAGHLSGENGEVGVFADLSKLKTGDKLFVEDSNGAVLTFMVQEIREYEPGYAEEVFSLNDHPRLNLITCDGIWDEEKQSYSKRLVVFTDLLSPL
jgi:LPXTG-site transpeptidase (sortase) family protein